MKKVWIPIAIITLVLISYQNCSAPLEETTQTTASLRVLSSPTPMPTAPPKYSTPTPTPGPTATPMATPLPTPTPRPGPETVLMQRYYNASNGDHYVNVPNLNIPNWVPEQVFYKFYKNGGGARQRVYQCEYAGFHMITIETSCETQRTGSRFGNPQDMGVYVSMQQNDEATTVQLFRKVFDFNVYLQLPTLNPNEASDAGYSQAAGFGWIPQ